ncbi:MAG TPA: AAA family ATPase [Dehalococcoidia bacterium]|nr:AAA family ATPase [Dehalococcoidia bacterium]
MTAALPEQVLSDDENLRKSLGQLPEAMVRPYFIVISGLPGTGKSYLSRQLAARLPAAILESDALRQVLFPTPTYSPEESHRLFRAIHLTIEGLLKKGIPLILDATNLSEYHREHLYRIADKVEAKLIVVRVEAPPEVVRERMQARRERADPLDRSTADWRVYQRMRAQAQPIRRHHIAVDTSRDLAPAIDKIVRQALH